MVNKEIKIIEGSEDQSNSSQAVADEVIEVSLSEEKKVEAKNLLISEETTQPNERVEEVTDIVDIRGFIEVLPSTPTHTPKNFNDQIKISDSGLYVYDYVAESWLSIGGGKYNSGTLSLTSSGTPYLNVGFEPKLIKMECFNPSGSPSASPGLSRGSWSSSGYACISYIPGTGYYLYTSHLVRCYQSGGANGVFVQVSSVDSSGANLTVTVSGGSGSIIWEAFG